MAKIEAAFAVKFNAPAEVTARVPDPDVEIVKLPEVLVQEEVDPEAITRAPVELPMLVAFVPVALMLAVPPVIVNPAEPVKRAAEVIVPEPVVEMLPEVERVPEVLTVS
jgi:hypothetical protein